MPVTSTVTLLFCDLVGSTERQSRLGDDAADEFLRRMFAAMRYTAEQTRGEVIKILGDGTMMVFRASTVDALTCAMALHDNVASLDPLDPPLLRIGISAGEVSHAEGDVFGMPVIEAARLCAAATAGQTLATDVVRALVGTRGRYELAPVGDLALKGIPDPVPTVEIRRLSDGAPDPRVSQQPAAGTATPTSAPSPRATPAAPAPPLGPPMMPGPPGLPTAPTNAAATSSAGGTPRSKGTNKGVLIAGALVGAAVLVAVGIAIGGRSASDVETTGSESAPSSQVADEPTSSEEINVSPSAAASPPPVDEGPTTDAATPEGGVTVPGGARVVPVPDVSVAADRASPISPEDPIVDVAFTPNLPNYAVTFELPEASTYYVYWSSTDALKTVPVTVTLIPSTGDALQLDILDFGSFELQVALGGTNRVLIEVPEGTIGAGYVQLSVAS